MTSLLNPISLAPVNPLELTPGPHSDGEGYDLLEAVALHAGERHSAWPESVSEVATAFLQMVNDAMLDADRQRLLVFLGPLALTGKEQDHAKREQDRRCILLDSATRVFLPVALMRVNLQSHAPAFAGINSILQPTGAQRVAEELDLLQGRSELSPVSDLIQGVAVACRTLPTAKTKRDIGFAVLKAFDPLNLCFDSKVRPLAVRSALECIECLLNPKSSRRGWLRQKVQ